ncbi:hypothetical protein ACN6A1_28005 [Myxococcus virescens]|uniref:hypothetical protein n=1 Tax=Myxococcus virescens TaxID=83456 RepID=UPI003DA3578E
MRWLRGTADLNRQGSGMATVRVTAPALYRVRSVASARRARDSYVEVSEAEGATPQGLQAEEAVARRFLP